MADPTLADVDKGYKEEDDEDYNPDRECSLPASSTVAGWPSVREAPLTPFLLPGLLCVSVSASLPTAAASVLLPRGPRGSGLGQGRGRG